MAKHGGKSYLKNNCKVIDYEEKGTGLQTEISLEPGTQILDELPVAYVVSNKQREVKCSYCLGPQSSTSVDEYQSIQPILHKCSKCKFVYYCGVTCQKKDWSIHKRECKNVIKVWPKRPPDICLLASRLLTVLARREVERCEVSPSMESMIFTFERLKLKIEKVMKEQEQHMTDKRKEMLITFAVVLQSFVDSKTIQSCHGISFSNLLGFLYWLTCNCFNILDDDLNSVGIGIFETASLINHSCAPNCVAIFEGSRISVRTICPISNGEEITISYIESIVKGKERQSELQERYLFTCSCRKCMSDSANQDLLIGKCENPECTGNSLVDENSAKCSRCGYNFCSDNLYLKLRLSYEKLRQQLLSFNENKMSPKPDGLYDTMTEVSALIPNDTVEMIKCYEMLFDAFIESQDWKMALEHGLLLLEGYKNYYPKIHPITGIHLFKLGKLELVLENLRPGLDFLEQCMEMLFLTHGKEHRIAGYLLELILKLREEIKETESRQMSLE